MKKRTIMNMLMVVIIVAIVAGGILGVGHIRGWFDSADGTQAVLQEIVGVVNMERNGVRYTVEGATVLRAGDQITTQKGATAVIAVGENRITVGGSSEVTIVEPQKENVSVSVQSGQVFVDTVAPVTLSFEADEVTVSEATVALSVRSGAQTLRVFRGSVGEVTEGKATEYVADSAKIMNMQLEALDDFLMDQIRKTNEGKVLCFTNKELDELADKRKQEIEDLLNGATTPTEHQHAFDVSIVPATCTEKGYTIHTCACGETYTENETAPVGHNFGQWTLVKAATTEESGLMERQCAACGEKETKTVEPVAVGHSHSYTVTVVEPSCTEGGYTLHTCACGESYRDAETVARGHHYTEKVVAPTCTTKGYTLHTCACGDAYTDSIRDCLQHQFGEWKTVKEATEEEDGLQERYCSSCNAREEKVIPCLKIAGYVTITIRCDTILNNMEDLKPEKVEFVPSDGEILPVVRVPFYEDETVFDVLVRVCKTAGIHMDYVLSPMYGTNYIRGINNLYEKDCGAESGWMYKVNGWFPNYGVSGYKLSDGDAIVFAYTCKGYGTDVGAPEWEGD